MKCRRLHSRTGIFTLAFALCAGFAPDVTAQTQEVHLSPVIYMGAGSGTNLAATSAWDSSFRWMSGEADTSH